MGTSLVFYTILGLVFMICNKTKAFIGYSLAYVRFEFLVRCGIPKLSKNLKKRRDGTGEIMKYRLEGSKDFHRYIEVKEQFGHHPLKYQLMLGLVLASPLDFTGTDEFSEFLKGCHNSRDRMRMTALKAMEMIYLDAIQIRGLSEEQYQIISHAIEQIQQLSRKRIGIN